MKDTVLDISRDIISSELPDELLVYKTFESSLYDMTQEKEEHVLVEESHFGGEESLAAYYVLGVVAWVSTVMANEGLKIGKIALYNWFSDNKDKLEKRYTSEKYKKAIKIIEHYLENEVKK